jgi:hypothetical protein
MVVKTLHLVRKKMLLTIPDFKRLRDAGITTTAGVKETII